MQRNLKILLSLATALFFAACGDSSSSSNDEDQVLLSTTVKKDGIDMLSFGSLNLDVAADSFLAVFELGDIVTVMVDGYDTLEVPVVPDYDAVSPGELLLRAVSGKPHVTLGINFGQLAVALGGEPGHQDAASGAVYGARAANGVILVTTKKGKEGKVHVNYDFSYGMQNPWRKPAVLNATEYAVMMNEGMLNDGQTPIYADPYSLGEGTDWVDAIFDKNSPIVKHDVNIMGGSEKSETAVLVVGPGLVQARNGFAVSVEGSAKIHHREP